VTEEIVAVEEEEEWTHSVDEVGDTEVAEAVAVEAAVGEMAMVTAAKSGPRLHITHENPADATRARALDPTPLVSTIITEHLIASVNGARG